MSDTIIMFTKKRISIKVNNLMGGLVIIVNLIESDILICLKEKDLTTQRDLSSSLGYSLGAINKSLKHLTDENYIDSTMRITKKAEEILQQKSPKSAIILAAGLGLRMVPINNNISKGLLEVRGEILIERLISQLNKAGIFKIYIIVGYMKEQYEYLIDKYNVELIVNKDYALTNSIVSLGLALDYISNTYIIPCDIWCKENPFRKNELYSWYMVSNELSCKSYVRVNRKKQLVFTDSKNLQGNRMIGICYVENNDAKKLKNNIKELLKLQTNNGLFWDDALKMKDKFLLSARLVSQNDFCEIDTYEQLQALDNNSNQLKSDVIELLTEIFNVKKNEIKNISALKKGMTNRSFLFNIGNERYIMRIPGEGTDKLINRKEEADVYNVIKDKRICDEIVYINPENGYKVTKYVKGARTCDALNCDDIKKCMTALKAFHNLNLKVGHNFDVYKQIEFYESLWEGQKSVYRDYNETKKNVYELKDYIDCHKKKFCLTHIDAVPDNFLIFNDGNAEKIILIDWEYAGMQDSDIDLAMFSIYSLYDKSQIDNLIQYYYDEGCTKETKIKIYCYIAVCGLLWSNWCEYKRMLGVEFGEYALRQYRYAKDYYRLVKKELADE